MRARSGGGGSERIQRRGLPNEDGKTNCADIDSVELAQDGCSLDENKSASGNLATGDAKGAHSGAL